VRDIRPGWRHGAYQGPLTVDGETVDLIDPATAGRLIGITDNLARFTRDGQLGYGLFELETLTVASRSTRGRRWSWPVSACTASPCSGAASRATTRRGSGSHERTIPR